ncbi:MAG: hypothetical protein ABJK25_04640 [Halieaceae bacterium]
MGSIEAYPEEEYAMTTAQAIEHRVVKSLLQRYAPPTQSPTPVADRVIRLTATVAAVFFLGAYLQELLWVTVAAATITALALSK